MSKLSVFVLALCLTALPSMAQEPAGVGSSFAGLVEKLLPEVVNISTTRSEPADKNEVEVLSANEHIRNYFLQDEGGRTSLGSGFLIDSKGYIMTNDHVIAGADEIVVTLADGRQFPAQVAGHDKMTDLALIKIDVGEPLPFAEMGDSDALRVGDWILAVGNPFGLGGSVTAGIVSAKSRDIDAGSYDNFIQTDAAVNQGSSGGPLFDMSGKVVGINTAIFSSNGGSMGISFATPVNLSKFVAEQLMSKGRVERGWLGLKVAANVEDIVLSDSQTFRGGVTVSSIGENSPAMTSGIEAGDVIIAFNGNDIKDAKSFSRSVAETPVGSTVILRLWRSGQIKDVSMTVAAMPEDRTSETTEPAAEVAAAEKPAGYIEKLGLVVAAGDNSVSISEVLADSDAALKGLKQGDIIQKIDGRDVTTVEDLLSYVAYAETAGGPPVEMRVLRDGLPQTVQLEITADDQN